MIKDLSSENILGIEFTNASKDEILEFITKGLDKPQEKYYVVTPNPELVVIASTDTEYKKVLNGARLALPDGIGVLIAAKALGKPLKERFTGVDLVENLCFCISKQPATAGFLGAKPGVAEKASECLQKLYPGLKVKYAISEWEDKYLNVKVDILFVAFGSPKQELWIKNNIDKLPVKVLVGVGGAFDFISGNVPRAPAYLRKIGLEWLFRLFIQPWRIRRQLTLFKFVWLVILEKFKSDRNK